MLPDAECVKLAAEILTSLNIGDISIKVRLIGCIICMKCSYYDVYRINSHLFEIEKY